MKKPEVKYNDPPRYPTITNKIECIAKDKFDTMLKVTVSEIGKIMGK